MDTATQASIGIRRVGLALVALVGGGLVAWSTMLLTTFFPSLGTLLVFVLPALLVLLLGWGFWQRSRVAAGAFMTGGLLYVIFFYWLIATMSRGLSDF